MIKNISGPVSLYVYKYNGVTYYMFGDHHNNTEGGCDENGSVCSRYIRPGEVVDRNDDCDTIPVLILDKLKQGNTDFYLEFSFVVGNNIPQRSGDLSELDYIDQMSILLDNVLRKDKSQSDLPRSSRVHYTDIRDITMNDGQVISSNPFSGGWAVGLLHQAFESDNPNTLINVWTDVATIYKWILNNANSIAGICIDKQSIDYIISMATNQLNGHLINMNTLNGWIQRLVNMKYMMSKYRNQTVHRCLKQLLKLDVNTHTSLIDWLEIRFEEELVISKTKYKQWCEKWQVIITAYSQDRDMATSLYKHIKGDVILIVVALSSIIMDIYAMARSFYNKNKSKSVYYYAGSAHVDNMKKYFEFVGAELLETKEGVSGAKRCLRK